MVRAPFRRLAALTATVVVTACSSGAAETLPPPSTVTIVPAAGAPEQPAAAGPITTTTTAPTTTTSMPGSTFYAVQDGDTLYGIASRLNTTVEVLIRLNPMKDTNRLLVGQELIVPAAGATTATVAGSVGSQSPVTSSATDAVTEDPGSGSGAGLGGGVPSEGADPGSDSEVTGSTLPAATKDG